MVLLIIVMVVVFVAYVKGNARRKEKIRRIGTDVVDITKETISETVGYAKSKIEIIKNKMSSADD